MVNALDLEHTEPEVDRSTRHREQIPHYANELDFEHLEPEVDYVRDSEHRYNTHNTNTSEVHFETLGHGRDAHCPVGYSRVGCCKCVLDAHAGAEHLGGVATEHGGLSTEHHTMPTHGGLHANDPMGDENNYRGQMYGYEDPPYESDEYDRRDYRRRDDDRYSDDRR